MKKRIFFLALYFLLSSGIASAQKKPPEITRPRFVEAKIVGFVYNLESFPIGDVLVSIDDTNNWVKTNSNGAFTLKVPKKYYGEFIRVKFLAKRYEPYPFVLYVRVSRTLVEVYLGTTTVNNKK